MRAVIIEDETAAVNSLKTLLARNSVAPVEIVAELESIEESVAYFRYSPHPDIVFMDIHLADGSAFKIFERVEIGAPVVFTTAYDAYALQAFEVCGIDYLLKPVTRESLERALRKSLRFDNEERQARVLRANEQFQGYPAIRSLLIMLPDKFYPLPVEDILFFYTANERVTAYTADGRQHPVDRTLDALAEGLDKRFFFRANRQFIIARSAVKDVDLWFGNRYSVNLVVPVPERIIVSKNKASSFKRWILGEGL